MDNSSLTVWLAIARVIHFASCLLIGGVWMFDRLIFIQSTPPWRRVAISILLTATPIALLSGVAWFVLVTADISDLSVLTAAHDLASLKLVWVGTRFGHAMQIHLFCWIAGLVCVGTYFMRRARWIGLLTSAGLVASLAWTGHGSTGPESRWHLLADVIHLLACTIWPAGLVPLAFLLTRFIRSRRWAEVAIITRRFSTASLFAVSAVTISGLISSWCLIGSLYALLATHYGNVLLVKLVLFMLMVGIGAINLLVLKPKISEGGMTARKLRRNVIVEIALGTGVVAVVGLLGLLEPIHS